TSNVPYIVGLAAAFRLTVDRRARDLDHFRKLSSRLRETILKIPDSKLTGHPTNRLPNHSSFVFKNIDGNELLMRLDLEGIAASSGSACKTGDPEPSNVILALGYDRAWALGSLRLTVGRHTTDDEIKKACEVVARVIEGMRK
ncbi:MAG: aminotransferase class V-fold PLP-dependent enzyme, partial [Candidatus Omnitrophica bacterium]|nr:aminotransferase class V-fold PLP-dependent enzyme [Candidatus Omnitrophota bacterium]